MSDQWIEAKAPDRDAMVAIYAAADKRGCSSIHHFQEPWYPDGAVIRILGTAKVLAPIMLDMEDMGFAWSVWDATPDELLFGAMWAQVRAHFESSSRVALAMCDYEKCAWVRLKLVHCTLNSWGFDVAQEADFMESFVKGRRKMVRHCRWWWFRELIGWRGSCELGCHKPDWAVKRTETA